jgi:hypothetical protein
VLHLISIPLSIVSLKLRFVISDIVKVKIELDGKEVFSHGEFDNLINYDDSNCSKYDLELYTVPSMIRKILKTTKLREIV